MTTDAYTAMRPDPTDVCEVTLARIIGATGNRVDRETCVAALAYARHVGCEPTAREMIRDAHRYWLDWLTVTQRKWQGHTRRPSRARHHDSIAIRESYVRCHNH